MNPAEIDIALEELEVRLERLRALYQQYFLGIEKIEPSVPRKDVDRRLWELRRAQFRNTAKRFKLNTIIQRYNTFQQYWTRICREIENGTYKRHLLRAESSFGPSNALSQAERRRLGLERGGKGKGKEADQREDKAKQAARQVEDELSDFLAKDFDPLEEAKKAIDEALGNLPTTPSTSEISEKSSAPSHQKKLEDKGEPTRPSQRKKSLRPLELDMDFLGETKKPPDAPRKNAPAISQPESSAGQPPSKVKKPSTSRSGTRPRPGGAKTFKRDQESGPQPLHKPMRSAIGTSLKSGQRGPFSQGSPSRARSSTSSEGALSDQKVQQLHSKLVATKRKLNQKTEVSVDGLAKQLHATLPKLQAKHKDKKIDFDVVVKNGKAVLKPIVR